MTEDLPRDADGYVNIDSLPDEEVDLSVPGWDDIPAILDQTWDLIVRSAPHADVDDADLGRLVMVPQPMESPVEPEGLEESSEVPWVYHLDDGLPWADSLPEVSDPLSSEHDGL